MAGLATWGNWIKHYARMPPRAQMREGEKGSGVLARLLAGDDARGSVKKLNLEIEAIKRKPEVF